MFPDLHPCNDPGKSRAMSEDHESRIFTSLARKVAEVACKDAWVEKERRSFPGRKIQRKAATTAKDSEACSHPLNARGRLFDFFCLLNRRE
jgi:hypothetical protein